MVLESGILLERCSFQLSLVAFIQIIWYCSASQSFSSTLNVSLQSSRHKGLQYAAAQFDNETNIGFPGILTENLMLEFMGTLVGSWQRHWAPPKRNNWQTETTTHVLNARCKHFRTQKVPVWINMHSNHLIPTTYRWNVEPTKNKNDSQGDPRRVINPINQQFRSTNATEKKWLVDSCFGFTTLRFAKTRAS